MRRSILYSCGHYDDVLLTGKDKDRKSKIKFLEEEGLCRECYKRWKSAQESKGCDPRRMLYKEYKTHWTWCKTKYDSYDKNDKSIIVYMPDDIVDFYDSLNCEDIESCYKEFYNMILFKSPNIQRLIDPGILGYVPILTENWIKKFQNWAREKHPETFEEKK